MTVLNDVPGLDLAPTVPSRTVYGTVLIPTEDRGPKGAWIEAAIPGEIKLPGEHTTITGRSKRFPVHPDGSFEIRLPTLAAGIEPEDWALSVRLSWRPVAFPMRVPVGTEPIWIEDCIFPELVPGEDPAKYFLAGAQIRSVTTVGPDQPANAKIDVANGVLSVDLDLPRGLQGLPGVNALPADEAVAGYVAGGSATRAALEAEFASRDTAPTASHTAVTYWVSPTGSDSASGSAAAPFRTLAQAISMIPDVVRSDHHFTISLTEGDWGSETLTLAHRLVYGSLTITGASGDREKHRIHRVHATALFGRVRFENITATRAGTLGGPAWWFQSAMPWIEVYNCKALAVDPSIRADSGVIGLLADYGSVVHAEESDFNGRRYGLRANYSSRIYSKRNTGTGNVFAVGARWGGIMNTYGSQPGAETTFTTDSGGMISRGKGGKVGAPEDELFLSEAHEASEGRHVRKKWLLRHSAPSLPSIGDGQRLRLTFRKNDSNAPHMMDVQWAGSPVVGSAIRHVRTIIAAMITETGVQSVSSTVLAGAAGSGGNTANMVQLSHSGSGNVFYLDIVPPAALMDTWYGVDVEISNMRNWNAPTLLSVGVV